MFVKSIKVASEPIKISSGPFLMEEVNYTGCQETIMKLQVVK
jgi:hypothetical protein